MRLWISSSNLVAPNTPQSIMFKIVGFMGQTTPQSITCQIIRSIGRSNSLGDMPNNQSTLYKDNSL